jgi:hypothetical protein
VSDLEAVAAEPESAEESAGLKLFRGRQRIAGIEPMAVIADQRDCVGLCCHVVG